jgi:hypothetical protein
VLGTAGLPLALWQARAVGCHVCLRGHSTVLQLSQLACVCLHGIGGAVLQHLAGLQSVLVCRHATVTRQACAWCLVL